MPRYEGIRVGGEVKEVLPNGLFRMELPNGHVVMAHVLRRLRPEAERLRVGDRVMIEMSPFDMSEGCVVDFNAIET